MQSQQTSDDSCDRDIIAIGRSVCMAMQASSQHPGTKMISSAERESHSLAGYKLRRSAHYNEN